MSLINKMLQDLDARGGPNGAARAPMVPFARRRSPNMVMGLLGLVLTIGVAGAIGYATWQYFKKPAAPVKPGVTMLAAATAAKLPDAAPVAAPPAQPAEAAVAEETAAAAGDKEAVVVERVAAVPAQDAERGADKEAAEDAGAEEATPAAAPVRPAAPARGGDKPARTVSAGKAVALAPIREMTPQQKAEADYKRANASLQEGRITEAVATLERALQQDPRHEAARQTLAGLLIEARRSDEAIRVLQAGLVLEPNQPNMAMLLARLQIERGGPGIETLQRTLPYAEGNAEYHAFLAGALQREQRHREAVEHYATAIRHGGQNGVWLMGLGISLLAEKRNPEALDAFRRAKASGNLSPELSAYVERRLQALAK